MRNDISIVRAAAGGFVALACVLAGCASNPPEETASSPAAAEQPAPPATEAAPAAATGAPVELQENAPEHYVVQKGDTLWGIANKFLKDSWQWPEVWVVNPHVKNPHLIYPGDELVLYFEGGAPRIAKAGDGGVKEGGKVASTEPALPPGGLSDVRPRIRESALDNAIYAIPLEQIKQFLRGPRVIDEDQLDDAPYLVDFQSDHLMAATDDVAYALNVTKRDITQYQVVRRSQAYRDPDDNDVVGYEVLPVAEAEVRAFGDPSTVYLNRSTMEAVAGDYLLPMDKDPLAMRFVPHAPASDVDGKIISVYNGVSEIGQYQIVAINRGKEQGIEPGHVLTVMQTGREAKDPYSFFGSKVQLPDIKAGTIMVFKVAPRMSYALVWDATRAIHVKDRVERPGR